MSAVRTFAVEYAHAYRDCYVWLYRHCPLWRWMLSAGCVPGSPLVHELDQLRRDCVVMTTRTGAAGETSPSANGITNRALRGPRAVVVPAVPEPSNARLRTVPLFLPHAFGRTFRVRDRLTATRFRGVRGGGEPSTSRSARRPSCARDVSAHGVTGDPWTALCTPMKHADCRPVPGSPSRVGGPAPKLRRGVGLSTSVSPTPD
jgi:hypothetical protein